MAKALFIGSIAAAVLLTSLCSDVRPPYPELNPALGKYQNAMDCLPIQETWYPVYRNYESDPAFGGKEKCGRFSSLGPAENGSFPMLFEHGQSSLKVISTPVASEGYATNNLEYFQVEGENGSLLMYIAYLDCHHQQCLVFRNNYISDEACTLYLPESALGKTATCCDFIFDLLCGTKQKFYTYDESCTD
ncbi:uncharacterized protein LOC121836470 [Ixodes scapularis]|uniref:uncharacterized protein LOC121836470 n=1 Tax=Ixodes scapularis TaxID=6945 RepID=UPI001C392238|nr:uncharacterized protein LOC121836470 [Ixodes scapularis]